jgi:hypothetical protein
VAERSSAPGWRGLSPDFGVGLSHGCDLGRVPDPGRLVEMQIVFLKSLCVKIQQREGLFPLDGAG